MVLKSKDNPAIVGVIDTTTAAEYIRGERNRSCNQNRFLFRRTQDLRIRGHHNRRRSRQTFPFWGQNPQAPYDLL